MNYRERISKFKIELRQVPWSDWVGGTEIDSFCNPEGKYPIRTLVGGGKRLTIRYQTFFTKGQHWSPLNFRWLHLSVFLIFSHLSLCVFGINFIGYERSGDHKTPANKLDFNLHQINKGGDKYRGG